MTDSPEEWISIARRMRDEGATYKEIGATVGRRRADGARDVNMNLRFLSVCSGLEGASLAFEPLGWTAVGFAEVKHNQPTP